MKRFFKNPGAFYFYLVLLLCTGLGLIFVLPINLWPEVVKPAFRVLIGHRQIQDIDVMRDRYLSQIEAHIKDMEGLETYQIALSSDRIDLQAEFQWGVDSVAIEQQLRIYFDDLRNREHPDMWVWIQNEADKTSGSLLMGVSSSSMDSISLAEAINSDLRQEIMQVDGVKGAWAWGGRSQKRHELLLDYEKASRLNVRPSEIRSAIRQGLENRKLGNLKEDIMSWGANVLVESRVQSIEDILNLELRKREDGLKTIRIRDLAQFRSIRADRESVFRLNGKDAVNLDVKLMNGGNLLRTCTAVMNRVREYEKNNPHIDFNVIVNPAVFVGQSMRNLLFNIFLGSLVSVLVIYLFWGRLRETLIISFSIPFCVILSFLFFKPLGLSLNLISLGGMAIAVGLIVDSSIVVLENILRKRKTNDLEEITHSTREVFLSVLAGVMTSIIVFLPLSFTRSYTRAILSDLTLSIVFTLLISILCAGVIVPFLYFRMSRKSQATSQVQRGWLNTQVDRFLPVYRLFLYRILRWSFKKRLLILAAGLMIFLISLMTLPFIKKEIIAIPSSNIMTVNLDLHDSQDANDVLSVVSTWESVLANMPQVKTYQFSFGNINRGRVTILLNRVSQFNEVESELVHHFSDELLYDMRISKWDPGSMPLPETKDIKMDITRLDGRGRVTNEMVEGLIKYLRQNSFRVWEEPRSRTERFHSIRYLPQLEDLPNNTHYDILSTAMGNGYTLGRLPFMENETLYLRMADPFYIKNWDRLQDFPVFYKGKAVPLSALTHMQWVARPMDAVLMSEDREVYRISAAYQEREAMSNSLETVEAALREEASLSGLAVSFLEPNPELSSSYRSFAISLILSILLIYLILLLLFNRLLDPLLILLPLPLAYSGSLLGLFIFRSTISLNSMLGIMLVSGLVVNNSILILDFFLRNRSGMNVTKALAEACAMRLKPILITTLTSTLGILPVALGLGNGGEVLQPLGIAVFCGLTVATLFTLVLFPVLLSLFRSRSE